MTYTVSSSRVWVWSGGSSPGRTRHSTTAQSPPDCSPTIFSSALEPWPLVTVRPPPGPVRTGSLRDMCLPFHAVVGQAGRRARSSQMLLVAVSAGDAAGRSHLAIATDPRGHRQVRRAHASPRLSEGRACRLGADRDRHPGDAAGRLGLIACRAGFLTLLLLASAAFATCERGSRRTDAPLHAATPRIRHRLTSSLGSRSARAQ